MDYNFGLNEAQVLNLVYRLPDTNMADFAEFHIPIYGTIRQDTSWLMQSEISTRLFQAILAILSMCATVSRFLAKEKRLLPIDPISIAAKANLLAGNKLNAFIPK